MTPFAKVAKAPRFSHRFARLCATSLHAHLSGRYAASRDYWMAEARLGDPDLRLTYVSFARNAHHSYLRSLKLALEGT